MNLVLDKNPTLGYDVCIELTTNKNGSDKMDKGDLVVADRVICSSKFTTINQLKLDMQIAKENGLIEFEYDCDGGRYIPTDKYIKLSDALDD